MKLIDRIRLRWRLFALAFLAAALVGCGAATTAAAVTSAVHDTIEVLKSARSLICTTKLDPLLGDPRAGQDRYVVAPAPSAGGAAPVVPVETPPSTPPDAGAVE